MARLPKTTAAQKMALEGHKALGIARHEELCRIKADRELIVVLQRQVDELSEKLARFELAA